MSGYVDLEELQGNVYFESATLDDRYVWEEVQPDPEIAEVTGGVWFDGLRRFRLVRCAHREADQDGKLCTHCGHQNPYEPPEQTAARKARKRPAK